VKSCNPFLFQPVLSERDQVCEFRVLQEGVLHAVSHHFPKACRREEGCKGRQGYEGQGKAHGKQRLEVDQGVFCKAAVFHSVESYYVDGSEVDEEKFKGISFAANVAYVRYEVPRPTFTS